MAGNQTTSTAHAGDAQEAKKMSGLASSRSELTSRKTLSRVPREPSSRVSKPSQAQLSPASPYPTKW